MGGRRRSKKRPLMKNLARYNNTFRLIKSFDRIVIFRFVLFPNLHLYNEDIFKTRTFSFLHARKKCFVIVKFCRDENNFG